MSELVAYRLRPQRSVWQRAWDAVRGTVVGPFNLKDPAYARIYGSGSRTYVDIPITMDSAFTFSAVWDAVNTGASDVAKLPLNLHKRRQDGGSDLYHDSKLFRLLKYEPNPEMGSMVFRRTLTAHALTSHGGYAEIERDQSPARRPVALWPITPDRVEPFRERVWNGTLGRYEFSGPLKYRIDGPNGSIIQAEDMIHIQGLGYDGYVGYELVHKARQAIALGLAAERFGATFFSTGASFGGILMSDEEPPDGEQEKALRKLIGDYQSEAGSARRFLTLFGQGWKYEKTGVNPRDSQMDELRDKQVEEVARFFGMPLHKLKLNKPGAVSYASVEMADLDYYKGFLLNWITVWEEELNRKLISRLESRQQFIKHNVNAFLRGDIKSRYEALGIARDKGIINADEWRELEDMNPQEGGQGKVYLVQSAQIPVDKLPTLVDAQIKKLEAPPPAPAPSGPSADDREALRVALERAERAEALAADAEQRAAEARARLAAAEADGTAKADELVALRETVAREQAHAAELLGLSEQFRERVDLIQTAKDVSDAERAREADARVSAEAARDAALEAELATLRREEVAQAAAAEAERVAAEARAAAEAAGADSAEARRQQAEAEALAAQAQAVAATATAAREAAEARVQETERALEAARAALVAADATQRQHDLARHAAVIAAHRGLVVDAMGRMVRRECEQARHKQATPEKLRRWLQGFPTLHESICVEALLPAIRTHLAWTQSTEDPRTVTVALVRAHVQTFTALVGGVLESDPEDFHVLLDQALTRWEADRANAVADALLAEEIRHVQN